MNTRIHKKHSRTYHPRVLMLIGILCIIGIGGAGGWYVWNRHFTLNAELETVFAQVDAITSYSQQVHTHIVFPDRELDIVGIYHNNANEKAFAAYATTTLTILDVAPEDQQHRFSLQNIALQDDVYTNIQTDSLVLQASIPASSEWRHFTRTTIPPQFQSISIPGPILDNLKLFSQHGIYVTPQENKGQESIGGMSLTHYTFTLSGEYPKEPGGPLPALLERIGPEGTISIWVDDSNIIRRMHFFNETYSSTTTISDINNAPTITAPDS